MAVEDDEVLPDGIKDGDGEDQADRKCRESSDRFRFATHSSRYDCQADDQSYEKVDRRLHLNQCQNLFDRNLRD